jgi:hypothetical protein
MKDGPLTMKQESPRRLQVQKGTSEELKALLGDGVLMFTASRQRDSSSNTSENRNDSSRPLPAQPVADSTREL